MERPVPHRVLPFLPKIAIRNADCKFVGNPSYNDEYREWKIDSKERPSRFKSRAYIPSTVPFEAHPTYGHDFISKPIERVKPIVPANRGVRFGSNPTSYSTDYADTFTRKDIARRYLKAINFSQF